MPAQAQSAINFIPINYDQEIISAKRNAAEYFYVHAESLLKRNDRMSARQAYDELMKVKEFYSDYKDIDARIQEALAKGINNVLFSIQNNSQIPFPPSFEEELLKISMKELNTLWVNYDTKKDKNKFYDYSIILNIKGIVVSPEQVKEESHTEEKEIQDGWQYVLDAKGNVMKDTAGNDIKVPKMKIITCKVIETHQLKTSLITGTLDYYNNATKQIIKTDPITAEAIFENHSAVPVGDTRALKPETAKKTGNKPMPFPSDPSMIMMANQKLKEMTKNIIWQNKGLITY